MPQPSKASLKHDQTNAPPEAPDIQPAEDEWRHHEHVSEQVQADADRLLKSAGDPDVAKHAIDVATARQEEGETSRRDFAASLGFDSYEALCEGSQLVGTIEGPDWYITPRPSQTSVVWNDRDLQIEFECKSRTEALNHLQRRKEEADAAERRAHPEGNAPAGKA